jgi:hypothetical protein
MLSVLAGPGHPLCDACHGVLEVTVEAPGAASGVCQTCSAVEHHRALLEGLPKGLIAVVGPEHRDDRPDAGHDSDRFQCGACGAPLPVDGLGRLVRCAYCQGVSRIPVVQLQGLSAPPPPDIWWLGFEGPSEERARLLRDLAGAVDDALIEEPPYAAFSLPRLAVRLAGSTLALALGTALALFGWLLLLLLR